MTLIAVANVLPLEAREALVKAAATKNTPGDPYARIRTINLTITRLKRQYPNFFKEEADEDSIE